MIAEGFADIMVDERMLRETDRPASYEGEDDLNRSDYGRKQTSVLNRVGTRQGLAVVSRSYRRIL